MSTPIPLPPVAAETVQAGRLFTGARFAVGASAANFVAISAIMGALKDHFTLTNEEVGWIGGAGMWGFTITMLIFGSLCDVLGMRLILRLAVLGHLGGALIMILGGGFWPLFLGALTLSMADGLVQAAVNPLTATLFPARKTEMFAKLHLWFPGGIVVGGLVAHALDQLLVDPWQAKLALILVPAASYGLLFLGQQFPLTERVQSGITFTQMCRETFFRPLFLLLALCMMLTASVELGPNRWLPSVLESAGIPGILVLVWISLLMALLRQFAGSIIRIVSPTGILLGSAVLAGVGLLWLSFVHNLATALAAGTVFAMGISYFWPTMIGVTSERVPKGGALALAMMGAAGMLAVGLVTAPMMGRIADSYLPDKLPAAPTVACLHKVVASYPALRDQTTPRRAADIDQAMALARAVLAAQAQAGVLPSFDTAAALRAAVAAAPKSEASHEAKQLLDPAENYGGQIAFRHVAALTVVLTIIFAALFLGDLARGGYKAEQLHAR